MNLLVVTGIFPPDRGGPASYVPRMAAALVARGHKVEVICLSDHLDHDDSGHPFHVHRIRRGLFWPSRVLLTTFAIWRAARRHDLVFVNGLASESAVAALLAGRPAVHKIVGDYAWERAVGRGWFRGTMDEYQSGAKNPLLRLLDFERTFPVRLARQVVVPSRYLSRIVQGWGIAPAQIQLIYNAVASSNQARDLSATLPEWSGKTLITVCRLVRWKGVEALIRLLPDLVDTRLVIAGDGHLREELTAVAQASSAAPRVIFLGDVPQRLVRSYLQQAHAFVLNSSYEGLPHVVLEAMSAGVPVVATAAGGTGEAVEDNVTGLLVPVGDSRALKAAIERLWHDPALGQRLVREAASRLSAHFEFEGMVNATEKILLGAVRSTAAPKAHLLSKTASIVKTS